MEDIRVEFQELLESISISKGNYPTQEVTNMRCFLKDHTPKKLYRYRTFNEYSIDSLMKDELWGNKPKAFNDLYDSNPGLNFHEFETFMEEYICPVVYKHLDKSIIETSIRKAYSHIIGRGSLNYIACFSESVDSPLMWAHYADSLRGFVLEYDFAELIGRCNVDVCERGKNNACDRFEMRYPLFPVIYNETRYNATKHIAWYVWQCLLNNGTIDSIYMPDYLIDIKPFLYKAKAWEYEKEWRLLSEENPKTGVKAKAIYINKDKISDVNKYLIEKIASDKGIPLIPLESDPLNLDYKMIKG